ncbi:VTT domain-containing protein [Sinomonas susongensis]|uniref:VTT domain-containing protein n=1 Tax=Sinomonas susongensis TaxID=1324851 RepID=UPI001109D305|nr:VTT domain-containing protein [Sinomonas susongensis]
MIRAALTHLAAAVPAAVQPRASILPDWLNPDVFLRDSPLGPWIVLVVCVIIFAETGLLIGFFLPGDSMLFTAGLLVATGAIQFNIWLLALFVVIAAIIGNQVGFLIGAKIGPALFSRPDSRLFKQENVRKAHEFFERHGGQSLILARFVPIIRTFVPVIAGVARMERRKFFLYNVLGAIPWAAGVTLLGAWLGHYTWVGQNIDLIFLVIVLVSLIPIFVEFAKARAARRRGAVSGTPVSEDTETERPEGR